MTGGDSGCSGFLATEESSSYYTPAKKTHSIAYIQTLQCILREKICAAGEAAGMEVTEALDAFAMLTELLVHATQHCTHTQTQTAG